MDYSKKAKELVAQMTLEEKASLLSGKDFWTLRGVERLELPSIMVTDGPHGLRKQQGDSDHLGIAASVPATCFPTASATACSFDRDLLYRIGVALGEECRQEDVSVILGPGVNAKRSPLCGRNFEYISEDPYLTGELGANLVNGIQSQNVGVSMKHYAANNQETRRTIADSVVDERALREIYLTGFEKVVKQAKPWTLMCAYNKLNGTFCSDNKRLLTDILRTEWGHDGLVMTDWGAMNDRVLGVLAGLDLQMPGDSGTNDKLVIEAVKNGSLPESAVDICVARVVAMILKSKERKPLRYEVEAHRELARRAATASAVLLKNENSMLPLPKGDSFALIGAFAKQPRYQGAGSSKINPHHTDSAYGALTAAGVEFNYADGYPLTGDAPDDAKIAEACAAAKGKDRVVIIAGLPDAYESEGFDRSKMTLPTCHDKLIEAVAAVNSHVIVVLLGGAPMELPWIDNVDAVLMCYLGGEAGGSAIADMLLGKDQPGGRLAETWPVKLADNPSHAYFPGYPKSVEYRESIYVGYRYYDKAKAAVRFPFGYGLSYTTFEYGRLRIAEPKVKDTDVVTASINIKNIGKVAGSEVVQLYVSHKKPSIFKADQELKAFEKITLKPGETQTVTFTLDKRSFAYYNINIADWHVESGEDELRVGASSRDIRATASIKVESTVQATIPDYSKTAPSYYNLAGGIDNVPDAEFVALLGHPLPPRVRDASKPFDASSTLGEVKETFVGKIFYNAAIKRAGKMLSDAEDIKLMMENMVGDMPLRMLSMMGGDSMGPNFIEGLITMFNGHFFKGLGLILNKKK